VREGRWGICGVPAGLPGHRAKLAENLDHFSSNSGARHGWLCWRCWRPCKLERRRIRRVGNWNPDVEAMLRFRRACV
jgi:hypothetical protein